MRKFFKSLLLMALLCVPWVMQAQSDTLTVADGSESNSYVPFYGYWMDASQHNQVIYPASMLTELVGSAITTITDRNTTKKTFRNYTVRLFGRGSLSLISSSGTSS